MIFDSSRSPWNFSAMNLRSSWTLNFEVLIMWSASARMGASMRRSARTLRATERVVPSGCGRRVSLKRRTRVASSASRNTSVVERIPFRRPYIAGKLFSACPSRMSTTSAARRMCGESLVSSASFGIRSIGRLSTE